MGAIYSRPGHRRGPHVIGAQSLCAPRLGCHRDSDVETAAVREGPTRTNRTTRTDDSDYQFKTSTRTDDSDRRLGPGTVTPQRCVGGRRTPPSPAADRAWAPVPAGRATSTAFPVAGKGGSLCACAASALGPPLGACPA